MLGAPMRDENIIYSHSAVNYFWFLAYILYLCFYLGEELTTILQLTYGQRSHRSYLLIKKTLNISQKYFNYKVANNVKTVINIMLENKKKSN